MTQEDAETARARSRVLATIIDPEGNPIGLASHAS
jgi:hypothetical protein